MVEGGLCHAAGNRCADVRWMAALDRTSARHYHFEHRRRHTPSLCSASRSSPGCCIARLAAALKITLSFCVETMEGRRKAEQCPSSRLWRSFDAKNEIASLVVITDLSAAKISLCVQALSRCPSPAA